MVRLHVFLHIPSCLFTSFVQEVAMKRLQSCQYLPIIPIWAATFSCLIPRHQGVPAAIQFSAWRGGSAKILTSAVDVPLFSLKLRFGASDPSFPTRQARDFACRPQDHGFLGQSVLVHGKELGSQLVSCGVPLRKMGKTISSKIISYSDSIFVGQKRSESHCFGNATWVPTPVPAS